MVSISNYIIVCILCLACSGCQKKDVSRICKEVQASCQTDQTYTSLFDDDLHEFTCTDEVNVGDSHVTESDQLEKNKESNL